MTITTRYPDLDGRAALVTGASSGIGLGIAEALLEQGMRVALGHRTGAAAVQALAARYPGRAVPIATDLATEEGAVALARRALAKLGGMDVLVHSAGLWSEGPIDRITQGQIEEVFRVNLFAAFYLVRELVEALRAARPGRIVMIGSTAGQRGEARHAHYAASKGGLGALVKSLAVELAPEVRTNLVSPGWVRTPMTQEALERIGEALVPTLPNRRVAEVEDVAQAVLYLASQASAHLVGQDLCVSGGALLVVPRGQVRAV